jgi:hypothetical protein
MNSIEREVIGRQLSFCRVAAKRQQLRRLQLIILAEKRGLLTPEQRAAAC